ncbi:Rad52/22 family double-strand break repair protein-domain-containing protein [Russula dissimulans]|nr:Rad52/22 family double-strand break repair protein-domain-containing protein [Russula dissimulans]
MFSEAQTPGTVFGDGFSETRRPIFDPRSSGASEASIIQTKLNRRLGPEYVSQRPAPGGGPKLTYVEGWKIIGLANEVFGYNGWCSTVTRIETDFIDMDPESRRFNVGITALVKITLRDGTYHEDIGYGTGENLKSKGAALDKAKKEAVTDGVKRALRNFGNLLGLCLYEKSFTQEVIKIKPQLVRVTKLAESTIQLCAHTFTTSLTACAFVHSQSLMSLTYTAGKNPLAVYHIQVVLTMSRRQRLPSHSNLSFRFRLSPKHVKPSPSSVLFGMPPGHFKRCNRTNKGQRRVRGR